MRSNASIWSTVNEIIQNFRIIRTNFSAWTTHFGDKIMPMGNGGLPLIRASPSRSARKEFLVGVKYRFKNGDEVSDWLLADGLREAARSKIVTAETYIQQAGRDDWISASSVPKLLIIAQTSIETETKETQRESPRHEHKLPTRPPESIHHLLHRALHTTIQVSAHGGEHESDQFVIGVLVGLTTDGMMIEFSDFSAIVYIPTARIRSAAILTNFPALGPPRNGEIVRIDVDSLPDLQTLIRPTSKAPAATSV
jgi:hypothetical protein